MRIKTTGKVSEAVLKRSVIKEIASLTKKEPYTLGVGQDATEFTVEASCPLCVSTATMEGNQMSYLTCTFVRALNNVLVKGAIPYGASVSILLNNSAKESELKLIMRQIQSLCEKHGVKLLGGETQTSATALTHIFTVTMLGSKMEPQVYQRSIPGEAYIVMTNTIGMAGTGIITQEHIKQLQERYTTSFLQGGIHMLEELSIQKDMQAAKKCSFLYAHDVSVGGIFPALWEVGEYLNCGMTINLEKIRLAQETIEICEYYDLNPYLLFSLGSVIFVTFDYHSLIETLQEHNIFASVIGTVNSSNDRLIINGEESRYLEPYKEDELFKVKS